MKKKTQLTGAGVGNFNNLNIVNNGVGMFFRDDFLCLTVFLLINKRTVMKIY